MSSGTTSPDSQLLPAAQLCFCAYVDNPNDTDSSNLNLTNIQKQVHLFYPDYQVVWSAKQTPNYNYGFIVRTPDNKYFLAIRGSLTFEVQGKIVIDWGTIYNWFKEDFNVFSQTAWPYGASGSNPYVANGAYDAFNDLLTAVDVMGSNLSAYEFLKQNAVAKGYSVYITGHSLGGNMADTYASYFASALQTDQQSNDNNYLFTFAAPAAGNQDFESDLENKFPPSRSYHYEINNDIIPKFPVFGTMWSTVAQLFSPAPSAPAIYFTFDKVNVYLSALVEGMATAIWLSAPHPYVQTPPTPADHALSGAYSTNDFPDWFEEAAYQHSCSHYVSIFGGDAIQEKMASAIPRMTKSKSAYASLRVDQRV